MDFAGMLSRATGPVIAGMFLGFTLILLVRHLQARQHRQARLQILLEDATESLLLRVYGPPAPSGIERAAAIMCLIHQYGYPFSRTNQSELFALYRTHPRSTKKREIRQRVAVEAAVEAFLRIEEDLESEDGSITLVDLAHNARSVPALMAMSSALSVIFNKLGPPPEGMTAYSDPQLRGGGGTAR
ncbi:hypothetical protein [Streptomyces sp. NPDC049949]|uniref:hypothetical protein n=1 Tax=Streptomyces sp. NPDC049949 TaxID=3154627 RepID=UPI0034396CC8